MLIESLELEAIGPLRDRVFVGPFDKGLSILAQPNEWGKSTLIKALGRAFFDRYTSTADPIRRLRPAGTTLSPEICAIFQARGDRYRLVKRFLDKRACELSRWDTDTWVRTDESDRADVRIRELLGAPALDGQQPRPETWGFIRYLWALQDDAAEWPSWDGAGGEAARRRLATVPVDEAVRTLLDRLEGRAAELFTSTGRVKRKSALDLVVEKRERLARELSEIRARRVALEDLELQFARLSAELPAFARAREEKVSQAARLRAEAEAATKQLAEIARLTEELRRTDERLQQVSKDQGATAARAELARLAQGERNEAANHFAEAESMLGPLEKELQRLDAEQREKLASRRALEEQLQVIREHLRIRVQADQLAKLRETRNGAHVLEGELKRLNEALLRLPVVTPVKLAEWRDMDRHLREDRVRLETIGLRVTLAPEKSARVIVNNAETPEEISAGTPKTIIASQRLEVQLEGWGRIEIESGAHEAATLQTSIAKRESMFAMALQAVGVATLEEAEAAAERAKELEQAVRSVRTQLGSQLGAWETIERLDHFIAKLVLEQERATVLAKENPKPAVELQTDEETLGSALRAMLLEETTQHAITHGTREQVDSLRRKREESRAQTATAEARLKGFSDQQEMIAQRYPGGLAVSLQEAQGEFMRAEARLAEAKRQLPADAATLVERSADATRAATAAESEAAAMRQELRQLEIRLEERGGEGLYSRESELAEMLATAEEEAARLLREGRAARLLCDLIRHHEQRAIGNVLTPLENRLSTVFAAITGVAHRRVWFDETLQIRGVGVRMEEAIAFDDLSRGAREQLLLALRAAIALELSAEGPQCLILDDVLVHTDPMRHQNVLGYLRELAEKVQVIVLTCHAERYRGAGRVIRPATVQRVGGSP